MSSVEENLSLTSQNWHYFDLVNTFSLQNDFNMWKGVIIPPCFQCAHATVLQHTHTHTVTTNGSEWSISTHRRRTKGIEADEALSLRRVLQEPVSGLHVFTFSDIIVAKRRRFNTLISYSKIMPQLSANSFRDGETFYSSRLTSRHKNPRPDE